MKNPEINVEREAEAKRKSLVEEKEKSESGYSEIKQAGDIEARSGDLHARKRSATFSSSQIAMVGAKSEVSKNSIFAYQKASQKLAELIGQYAILLEDDLLRAQKILEKINKAQDVQNKLYKKITGKLAPIQSGLEKNIEEDLLLKEVEDI